MSYVRVRPTIKHVPEELLSLPHHLSRTTFPIDSNKIESSRSQLVLRTGFHSRINDYTCAISNGFARWTLLKLLSWIHFIFCFCHFEQNHQQHQGSNNSLINFTESQKATERTFTTMVLLLLNYSSYCSSRRRIHFSCRRLFILRNWEYPTWSVGRTWTTWCSWPVPLLLLLLLLLPGRFCAQSNAFAIIYRNSPYWK